MRLSGVILGLFCLTAAATVAGCGPRSSPAPVEDRSRFTGGQVIVQPGDTAYEIARRAGVPVRDLIVANRLGPPYTLQIGQVLRVPDMRLYRVVLGDSLTSVAERFDVGRSDLARLNGLTSPFRLHPGQILKVPGTAGRTPATESRIASGQEVVPLPPPRPDRFRQAPPTTTADASSSTVASAPPRTTTTRPTPPRPAIVGPASTPTVARGGLIWPVSGRVVSRFGPKAGGLHNDGVNIAAPEGTAVRAMASGEVVYAGNELKGFGNLVLIRHGGGLTTAYAHLARMSVSRGQKVRAGDIIATVGRTGGVSPAQLHFEIRAGRKAVDPVRRLGSEPPPGTG